MQVGEGRGEQRHGMGNGSDVKEAEERSNQNKRGKVKG